MVGTLIGVTAHVLALCFAGHSNKLEIRGQEFLSPQILLSVDTRDPPTLILQGGADKTVAPAQAQAMHAALDKVWVENRLRMFAGADHDFYVKGDPARTDAYCVDAMAAMVAWFESHLKT